MISSLRYGLLITCLLSIVSSCLAQGLRLDAFNDLSGWKPITSDGVSLSLRTAPGVVGTCMALDFEFHSGAGYAIAQKSIPLDLPSNYRFSFYLRGDAPVNNFEFKLLDSLGNVFWIKKLDVAYPRDWKKTTVKKRHLSFAWGPSGGGEIRKVANVEFVVSAGSGGRGTIEVDEFRLEPLPDSLGSIPPASVSFSSVQEGRVPRFDDRDSSVTAWASHPDSVRACLRIGLNAEYDLGGMVIDWDSDDYASAYSVQYSEDGVVWLDGYTVRNGNGGRDHIPLPEISTRFVRLDLRACSRGKGYRMRGLKLQPPEYAATPNALFAAIAAEARRGLYPGYLSGEQTYWTVVGSSGDTGEGLIDEAGAVEVGKGGFRLEPFLFLDSLLITRVEGTLAQSLDNGYLPVPSVNRTAHGVNLTVRAFAVGNAGRSSLIVTYAVKNQRTVPIRGSLFVAVRPLQVLPPWHELNLIGGVSRIDSMRLVGPRLLVNGTRSVIALTASDGFGAAEFDQGDVTEYLIADRLPQGVGVHDHAGVASGAFRFPVRLPPDTAQEFHFLIPLHRDVQHLPVTFTPTEASSFIRQLLDSARMYWESRLGGFDIRLPERAGDVVRTIKSTLAYILINRDGAAIQPGSRTYERSWIRDGSLTSTALLQAGHFSEVREYLDWYARYQYESGKIPCVVDWRGADPVPEHDSHGQFIYAVMQYFRFTGDTLWLRGKFDNIVRTVRYIQELRRERKTELYRSGTAEQRACYGLVPESISHEGYSSKPMHSYWDNFFVLRGLKDATEMAHILGERDLESEFSAERDDFDSCLYASIRLAIANTGIDYIPGCVELGDFDATSTTIGIVPGGELGRIPEPYLHRTFDIYYDYFLKRRDNLQQWENYTPYENRVIGAFVHFGQPSRAHALLDFFLGDRRPPGWNHWAEVVWRDRKAPRFVGDMPHTWVGSDFIRSVFSMFLYERERDGAAVLAAGIPEEWIADPAGVRVTGLRTYGGTLNYSLQKRGSRVIADVSGTVSASHRPVVLRSPLSAPLRWARVDGVRVKLPATEEIPIRKLPAHIELGY